MKGVITTVIDTAAIEKEITKVKSELSSLLKSIEGMTDGIMKLNDQIKSSTNMSELTKATNGMNTELGKLSAETKEYNRIKTESEKMSAKLAVAEARLEQVMNTQANSINEARDQNKVLNQVRNSLSKTDADYAKRLDALNKKLNENNKFIRESVDDYTKQKINIGNYGSALSGAGKLLGAFGVTLSAVNIAKKAFNSTIQATNDLADKYGKVMEQAKAGTDYFFRSLATGDFSNFLDGMNNAIRAAGEYFDAMDEIDDRLRAISVQEARYRKEIAEQKNIMSDQTKSNQERLDAAEKIQDAELKILTVRQNELKKVRDEEVKYAAEAHGIDSESLKDFVTNYNLREKEIEQARRVIKLRGEMESAMKGELILTGQGIALQQVYIKDQNKIAAATKAYHDALATQTSTQAEFNRQFEIYGTVADEVRDKIAKAEIDVIQQETQYNSSLRRVTSMRSGLTKQFNTEREKAAQEVTKKVMDAEEKYAELSIKSIADDEERKIGERAAAYEKDRLELAKNFKDKENLTEKEQQALKNLETIYQRDISEIREEHAAKRKEEAKKAKEILLNEQKKFVDNAIQLSEQEATKRALAAQEAQTAEENALLKQYQDGTIGKEQYEQQLADIRHKYDVAEIKDEIAQIEKILALDQLTSEKRKEVEKKLFDAKKALNDAETKNVVENLDKQNEARKKADKDRKKSIEKAKEYAQEAFNMAMDFLVQQQEARIADIDAQIQEVEDWKTRELEKLDESVMSEETRATETKRINEQAEADREKLEEEKRKEQQKMAIYQKAQSIVQTIINTAQAVSAALTIPVAGIALAAVVAAMGAAQVAIIAAQPLPKYRLGTDDHRGGLAIVGDGGKREYALTPSGKMFETPAMPTLIDLPKHTQVFPDYSSMMDYFRPEVPAYAKGTTTAPDFTEGIDRIEKAVQQIKPVQNVSMNLDSNGIWYVSQKGTRETRMICSKLKRNL